MKTDNQLDKLIEEYKQDRKKHPIKWMWKDFKWWLITSINWVRIKLTKNKSKMKTRPTINIQDEVSKIHAQYGITEMANYRIEKLFEKYVEQFSPKVKQLEWEEHVLFADMIVSEGFSLFIYMINIIDNTLYMGDTGQSFNTINEAKSAAQADFEARIKECLIIE